MLYLRGDTRPTLTTYSKDQFSISYSCDYKIIHAYIWLIVGFSTQFINIKPSGKEIGLKNATINVGIQLPK